MKDAVLQRRAYRAIFSFQTYVVILLQRRSLGCSYQGQLEVTAYTESCFSMLVVLFVLTKAQPEGFLITSHPKDCFQDCADCETGSLYHAIHTPSTLPRKNLNPQGSHAFLSHCPVTNHVRSFSVSYLKFSCSVRQFEL